MRSFTRSREVEDGDLLAVVADVEDLAHRARSFASAMSAPTTSLTKREAARLRAVAEHGDGVAEQAPACTKFGITMP